VKSGARYGVYDFFPLGNTIIQSTLTFLSSDKQNSFLLFCFFENDKKKPKKMQNIHQFVWSSSENEILKAKSKY